jgi:hypothetical protein
MQNNFFERGLLFIILLLILTAAGAYALDIEKRFINMPDTLFPVLAKQQRLELLEYHKAGQDDSVKNRFGKQSRMLFFDAAAHYLKIQTSQSSTFEMIVYAPDTAKSPVTGIIRTVCAPVCHSLATFYDSAWNVLPLRFEMPKASDWLDEKALNETGGGLQIENFTRINFISLSFEPYKQEFIVQNNNLDFLTGEEKEKIVRFILNEAKIYPLKYCF